MPRDKSLRWAAVAALAACLPFFRGASVANIFFVRDLTMFFWPQHLWLRGRLLSGVWPLWNPYAAAGQAVFPNALNQMFLPPVLLLRVLLPAVVGFNLIVAAPFPLAALGMWLFLRRRYSAAGSALGAVVFAACGPVVATANFPNLSWSVACMPWLFWAVDVDRARPSRRSFAIVAVIIALQVVAGEPVTQVATLGLLLAYTIVDADETSRGLITRRAGRLVAAMAAGAALSAVQSIPMTLAVQHSPRGFMRPDNFWSLHPLALAESLLPRVFGLDLEGTPLEQPWIHPLNSGRDPFFYSLYTGPIALLLGIVGASSGRRRWRVFWVTVGLAAVVAAFGDYTPLYPAVQRIVPVVRSFRFPVKFLLVASFAIATLAAGGADAGSRSARAMTVGAAIIALALIAVSGLVMVAPFTGARVFFAIGSRIGLADPVAGAEFLFKTIPPAASRVLLVLLAGGALTYAGWRATRDGAIARLALILLAAIDLVTVNAAINPVFPASQAGPPQWTAALAAHPSDRFYFGGKFSGWLAAGDPDLPPSQTLERPPNLTLEQWRTTIDAAIVLTPAAWGVRELLSYDLPVLWPIEHSWFVYLFEHADPATRLRVLARSGVRYCVTARPPSADAKPIRLVGNDFGAMGVYECVPNARRAYVVPRADIVSDVRAQLTQFFSETFDADGTALVERTASPAGTAGPPAAASARIVEDGDRRVVVDAGAGAEGGYLVLLDSFDSSWSAAVDGRRAEIVRANVLFRAVRLTPGSHRIEFVYRPTRFYASAAISIVALVFVGVFGFGGLRTNKASAAASAASDTARPAKNARGR